MRTKWFRRNIACLVVALSVLAFNPPPASAETKEQWAELVEIAQTQLMECGKGEGLRLYNANITKQEFLNSLLITCNDQAANFHNEYLNALRLSYSDSEARKKAAELFKFIFTGMVDTRANRPRSAN
ncbi:hypothetical protein [Ancylobacter sp. SL191]|uniref:hypothetical protein n=1 Tax=Ancylobacter sp. SL191 TaxID=2995166 RepID=UPI00227091A4|nr:hypothetical protein [Ancylobacter sp. SL191]WAC27872.1 hypothetical protein OU996_01985 [Ancylobacter sp. SL191]